MDNRQLVFAREYRGLTQSELAKNIVGLSQSNLSKFEKGLDILSDDVQNRIVKFLGFPKDFYKRKTNISFDNNNYRKKAGISKKDISRFEKQCQIIGYIVDEMSDSVEWVDYKVKSLNVDDGFSTDYIADYTRRTMGIAEDEPVKDIISALENVGIIVYEIEALEGFDGISFFTKKGYPIIIINKNMSNDRKRFTLAHELGHLVMHNENEFPISEDRNKEREANRFASQFLMPEKHIKNSLYDMRIGDLAILKKYWLTSKASIIVRAEYLNCIDKQRAIYFRTELSRNGERKMEKESVSIDAPKSIKTAYSLFKEELGYKDKDFEEYFALPKDIINDVFKIDKLKVIKIS